jgi:hypothetical protein
MGMVKSRERGEKIQVSLSIESKTGSFVHNNAEEGQVS